MKAGTVKPGMPPPSPSAPPVSLPAVVVVFPPGGIVNDVEIVVLVGGHETVVVVGGVVLGDELPVGSVGGNGVVVDVRDVVVVVVFPAGHGCELTDSGTKVCPMVGAPATNRMLKSRAPADQANRRREAGFMFNLSLDAPPGHLRDLGRL